MKEIYTILSKHFLQETTDEEDKAVAAFRENNKREFELLQKLWKNRDIEVSDFDSKKAWKKIQSKNGKRPGRIISLNRTIRRIAAAVIFIVVGSSSLYILTTRINQPNFSIVHTGVNENFNRISLSDGSVVWLNRNSTLTYPERFSGKERRVTLEGEAFFEVTKFRRHSFVVSTAHSEVSVLGTSFNVKTIGIQTEVVVKTGKVQVASQLTGEKVILNPDQKAVVSGSDLNHYKVENLNYMAWKTGVFEFINAPLEKVISSLNSYYREPIIFGPDTDFNCNLTAKFHNESIEEVVKIVETTCDLDIQKEGNHYIIK